ncbi:MAG: nucleoside recognition domain-containing protein, partial [Clostridia bacterium]
KRAFTVIFLATLVVWLLQSFTFALSSAPDVAHSMLGGIAGSIAPLFAPAGFGTAEATMAVLTGIMAKESVVSTLAVLSGLDAQSAQMADHMRAIFPSTLSALSFLSFILLYTPCVAAIAAMRREMESTRWALCAVLAQTMLAWITAVILYQAGRLFGLA